MLLETIDPARAEMMLAKNLRNRNMAQSVVANYARQMSEGRWLLNGDVIRFALDGTLLDGQHRLAGIVLSGVTLQCWVGRGFANETQLTMDAQRKRTAGDHLALIGIADGNKLASIVRMVSHWNGGERSMYGFGGNAGQMSSIEIADIVKAEPMYMHALTNAGLSNTRSIVPNRPAGTLFFLAGQLDHELADHFAASLSSGEMLASGDPVLTLRNYWARLSSQVGRKPGGGVYLNGGVRAWNALVEGRSLSSIAWKEPIIPNLTNPRQRRVRPRAS